MKPWTLRGVAPLPLLVATLFAASSLARGQTSAPGSETHLLRARARSDRGDLLLVPLPLAEIGSREAAEDWLRWAGETHPAFENRIRGVWDSDTFELSVRPELSFLLCEGDPAADPSGRVLLRVAETPGANAKKAKFRFDGADFGNADSTAEGMAPGMASPLLCISNAWVLPRSVLLDRWTREASGSRAGAAGVRREAERLLEALDRLSQGGSGRWRSEVSAFVRTNAFVWPGIVLSNECGRTVRIEGLGAPFDLPAGTSRSLFLSAPPKDDVVRWSARDASDPDDADSEWEPEAQSLRWNPFRVEAFVRTFRTPPGERKPNPVLEIPGRLLPSGAPASFVIRYADGTEESAEGLGNPAGGVGLSVAPHRAVAEVRMSAKDYHDAVLRVPGSSGGLLRGSRTTVEGDAPRRIPRPWPALVVTNAYDGEVEVSLDIGGRETLQILAPAAVHRFEFKNLLAAASEETGETNYYFYAKATDAQKPMQGLRSVRRGAADETVAIRLERRPPAPPPPASDPVPVAAAPSDSPAPSPVPVEPTPPWPDSEDLWNATQTLKTGPYMAAYNGLRGEKIDKAAAILARMQSFWPDPSVNKDGRMDVVRKMVSHMATCRDDRCPDCGTARRSYPREDPKSIAFWLVSARKWVPEQQTQRCREAIERAPESFGWPWDGDDDVGYDISGWITILWKTQPETGGKDVHPADREEVLEFWNGRNDAGRLFARAYRHAELCPGCPGCRKWLDRRRLFAGKDVEDRKGTILWELALSPSVDDEAWGDTPRPAPATLDAMLKIVKTWNRAASAAGREKGQ